ncbi:MAG: hypothetical protein M3Y87_37370 [Myxococcota bacterium]|nr:hypothetical protein [Myxococcota bacterium]
MTISRAAAAAGLLLSITLLGACDLLTLPRDRRDVHLITDWTLNPTGCDAEGDDVRASRTATHLMINPLGQTDDQEAIVTTCVRVPGAGDCATAGDDVDLDAEISLRMDRQPDGSYAASLAVHDEGAVCAGHVLDATLTFPAAQRFRLELRRSRFDIAAPVDCFLESSEQARISGCTELEVLHGDFEVVVEAEYESSSSSSGGFDDD